MSTIGTISAGAILGQANRFPTASAPTLNKGARTRFTRPASYSMGKNGAIGHNKRTGQNLALRNQVCSPSVLQTPIVGRCPLRLRIGASQITKFTPQYWPVA